MTRIHRTKLVNEIIKTDGKFFRVSFIKKDGSKRKMTGRLKCRKYVKGTGKALCQSSPYIRMFDVQNDGWRMINLDTIFSARISGTDYDVI